MACASRGSAPPGRTAGGRKGVGAPRPLLEVPQIELATARHLAHLARATGRAAGVAAGLPRLPQPKPYKRLEHAR